MRVVLSCLAGNESDIGLTPRILQGLFSRVDEAQEHPKSNISCRVDVRLVNHFKLICPQWIRPWGPRLGFVGGESSLILGTKLLPGLFRSRQFWHKNLLLNSPSLKDQHTALTLITIIKYEKQSHVFVDRLGTVRTLASPWYLCQFCERVGNCKLIKTFLISNLMPISP